MTVVDSQSCLSFLNADSDIPISIDTRHANVARLAIESGADIVNDVSGGQFDPDMLAIVSELGVPMVLMHMRGTPQTMMKLTSYSDVVGDVAQSLKAISQQAHLCGVYRWNQVVDPGIGFAKDLNGNLNLLQQLSTIRSTVGHIPILLGTSRKGFIGKVTGVEKPADRDPGSIASCIASFCLDDSFAPCNLIRVHNVPDSVQACQLMDAVRNAKVSIGEVIS
jgi:dihydropteroate synthase